MHHEEKFIGHASRKKSLKDMPHKEKFKGHATRRRI